MHGMYCTCYGYPGRYRISYGAFLGQSCQEEQCVYVSTLSIAVIRRPVVLGGRGSSVTNPNWGDLLNSRSMYEFRHTVDGMCSWRDPSPQARVQVSAHRSFVRSL